MSKPEFSRILLKLSGEILANKDGFGINPNKVKYLAEEIKSRRISMKDIWTRLQGNNINLMI